MAEGKALALSNDSALMSAEDLVAGLSNATAVVEDSGDGVPFLKLGRAGEGWFYGQNDTEVEEGSIWVIDPRTAMYGWTGFSADPQPGGKKLKKGEKEGPFNHLVSIREAYPSKPEQPGEAETVIEFKKSYSVQLICVSGEDAGTLVKYAPTSMGGVKEMKKLFQKMQKRVAYLHEKGEKLSKIFPAVMLESDSYPNKNYGGTTFIPILNVVRWTDAKLSDFRNVAAEPEPEPEPEPAPKKRRAVAAVVDTTIAETDEEDDEDTDDEPQPVRRRRRRKA